MTFRVLRAAAFGATILTVSLTTGTTLFAQPAPETLARFDSDNANGVTVSSLLRAQNQLIYGTASAGGRHDRGTIFAVKPGQGIRALYSFTGQEDGAQPMALVEGQRAGELYGLSRRSGASGTELVVFRFCVPAGLQVLAALPWAESYASHPALVRAANGTVYGTVGADGRIFRIQPYGSLQFVYTLTGDAAGTEVDGLAAAADGSIYGTTWQRVFDVGVEREAKALFRLTPDGSVTTLHNFAFSDYGPPFTMGLTVTRDGNVYGALRGDKSTMFRYGADGSLMSFGEGSYVQKLVGDSDGRIYGVRSTYPTDAPWVTELVKVEPDGSLLPVYTLDRGNLAGTAAALVYIDGSVYGAQVSEESYSIVYRYAADGGYHELAKLVNFPNGRQPKSLIQAPDGSWYGVTASGGAYNAGVIFRASAGGATELLYTFQGADDGAAPNVLALGSDGNLYGRTTALGPYAHGTFFRATRAGALSVQRAFDEPRQSEGAGLFEREPGIFFTSDESAPYGHIVKLFADGRRETLYTFTEADNSYNAPDTLVVGADGSFYGTTPGAYGPLVPPTYGAGDFYRVTLDGQFTRLATFNPSGDVLPYYGPTSLMQAADGSFYIATTTVPFLTNDSTFTDLLKITSDPLSVERVVGFKDSSITPGSLIQTRDGRLYATTRSGHFPPEGSTQSALRSPTIVEISADGQVSTLYAPQFSDAEITGFSPPGLPELHEAADGTLVAVLVRAQRAPSEILAFRR